ncbi:hypothetical protein M8C21_016708 [Ambrosia artemisiifolia]|uniref:Uncharacterized protein n=1 Tax=Ambrosia artemisiifolia TaxID=4212 RepID=A0AAD5GP81_AMBAR|nr:hypothetical protein M8C21_016708 [Ambrosia artemisiifolia]
MAALVTAHSSFIPFPSTLVTKAYTHSPSRVNMVQFRQPHPALSWAKGSSRSIFKAKVEGEPHVVVDDDEPAEKEEDEKELAEDGKGKRDRKEYYPPEYVARIFEGLEEPDEWTKLCMKKTYKTFGKVFGYENAHKTFGKIYWFDPEAK